MSDHFYSSKLRFIYLQMLRLEEKEKPIDMVSVIDEAGPENWLKMGGGSYLSELSGSVPTTVNFHYYEEIVKKYYQKRKTIEIAHRMKKESVHGDVEAICMKEFTICRGWRKSLQLRTLEKSERLCRMSFSNVKRIGEISAAFLQALLR